MYKIIEREILVPNIVHIKLEAPYVAQSAQPGQFVILRVDEQGERFPMSLADWDREKGTINIAFFVLGTSTIKLAALKEGDSILDCVGPLGNPTEIENYGNVLLACGCFGIGPTVMLAKTLKEKGNKIISVMEARSKAYLFWQERLREVSDEFHVVVGDSSYGKKEWTNDFIQEYLRAGDKVDIIFAHGCPFMMMECSKASKPFGVKTIVSLTTIMVDGTGMCGSCRTIVGGETKFACVDGPEFDGHEVDWDNLIMRQRRYIPEEYRSFSLWERDNWHKIMYVAPHEKEKLLMMQQG